MREMRVRFSEHDCPRLAWSTLCDMSTMDVLCNATQSQHVHVAAVGLSVLCSILSMVHFRSGMTLEVVAFAQRHNIVPKCSSRVFALLDGEQLEAVLNVMCVMLQHDTVSYRTVVASAAALQAIMAAAMNISESYCDVAQCCVACVVLSPHFSGWECECVAAVPQTSASAVIHALIERVIGDSDALDDAHAVARVIAASWKLPRAF